MSWHNSLKRQQYLERERKECKHEPELRDIYQDIDGTTIDATVKYCKKCNKEL